MKLGLLNTLTDGRGGGISGDGLALDLQFALDKTLTARRGPTPVFTRGSTGTFVGSNGLIQTAAVNSPRFDHTSAGVCRGLLIEESRTNTLTRSEGLDATPWSPINTTTITSNNTTAPDGATTAERFTVGATTQAYGTFNSATSWTSGVTYTTSFFCKADQITRVRIATGNPATHPISAIFDLTGNGSIVGTPTGTASIERYANGWYRCSVTATSTATGLTSLRLTAVTGTTDNYPGNSVDSFWAWGAQNEVGSFATSYIPTTTGSVVRSADVCSITGANFTSFYNNSEGTLVSNSYSNGVGSAQNPIVSIESGISQILRIRHVGATNRLGVIVSGAASSPSSGFDALNTLYKVALAASSTGADYAINGTQIADSFTGSSLTADNMKLSVSTAGLSNTTLASIRFYRKRLPVAKLQSLTA
jgi:hypothetical protein